MRCLAHCCECTMPRARMFRKLAPTRFDMRRQTLRPDVFKLRAIMTRSVMSGTLIGFPSLRMESTKEPR